MIEAFSDFFFLKQHVATRPQKMQLCLENPQVDRFMFVQMLNFMTDWDHNLNKWYMAIHNLKFFVVNQKN